MFGLSCGPAVKNSPANAGDMGLIPSPGRFHHATGKQSPGTATTEACEPWRGFVLRNKGSHHNALESGPPGVTTRESPLAAMKMQNRQ